MNVYLMRLLCLKIDGDDRDTTACKISVQKLYYRLQNGLKPLTLGGPPPASAGPKPEPVLCRDLPPLLLLIFVGVSLPLLLTVFVVDDDEPV